MEERPAGIIELERSRQDLERPVFVISRSMRIISLCSSARSPPCWASMAAAAANPSTSAQVFSRRCAAGNS